MQIFVYLARCRTYLSVLHSLTGFTVEESFSLNTSFGSVSASDEDELGEIAYSLDGGSGVFLIGNSTGELSLAMTLDFESE